MAERPEVEKRTAYISKRIKDLIELGRATFYLPEYRQGVPEEEILGVIVAKYCQWQGERIIKTMLSALEDANYHTLGAEIEGVVTKTFPYYLEDAKPNTLPVEE